VISGCRRTGLADVNHRPRGPVTTGAAPGGTRPADRAGGLLTPNGSAAFGEVPLSDRDEGHIVVEVRHDEPSGARPLSA
jgi:hypothetical protein